ncbi:MAG: hypothetical protein KF862_07305 [Chitinophagaceae bacterium]|nr:hypothetical protein [Chitinophagaceae bacterium]
MRNILFSILCLPAFGWGQISDPISPKKSITVGRLSGGLTFLAELSYVVGDNDTTYTLKFNDYRYSEITSIEYVSFSSVGNTKEKLYNLFLSVYENKKDKDYIKVFTLGETDVAISNYHGMASLDMGGPWFAVTRKQLDKLFGK